MFSKFFRESKQPNKNRMEFRKIIEDLSHFETIMMAEMKDNPELSTTIEKFSNNLQKIYDEVFFWRLKLKSLQKNQLCALENADTEDEDDSCHIVKKNEVLPPIILEVESFWTISEPDLHFRTGIPILKSYKLGEIEFDIILQEDDSILTPRT